MNFKMLKIIDVKMDCIGKLPNVGYEKLEF